MILNVQIVIMNLKFGVVLLKEKKRRTDVEKDDGGTEEFGGVGEFFREERERRSAETERKNDRDIPRLRKAAEEFSRGDGF